MPILFADIKQPCCWSLSSHVRWQALILFVCTENPVSHWLLMKDDKCQFSLPILNSLVGVYLLMKDGKFSLCLSILNKLVSHWLLMKDDKGQFGLPILNIIVGLYLLM